MNQTSVLLIIITALIATISRAHWIVRPHQQEWLKTKTANINSWLDSKRPLALVSTSEGKNKLFWWGFWFFWEARLVSLTIRRHSIWFLAFALLLLAFWAIAHRPITKYVVLVTTNSRTWPGPFKSIRSKVLTFVASIHRSVIGWILRSESAITYIPKAIAVGLLFSFTGIILVITSFISLIIVFLASLSVTAVATHPIYLVFVIPAFLICASLLLFYDTTVFMFRATLECNALFWSAFIVIVLALAQLVLKILLGFVVRMKEYEKGPLAVIIDIVAIVLILTAPLIQIQTIRR